MNTNLIISSLILISGFFFADPSLCTTLTADFHFSKKSSDFSNKNMIKVFDLPPNESINGINGFLFTITRTKTLNKPIVGSETLFSMNLSTNGQCPTDYESGNSYAQVYDKYKSITLWSSIIKQSNAGTNIFKFNYKYNTPYSEKYLPGSCVFMILDGSDFSGELYTMGGHISVAYNQNYRTRNISSRLYPLDSEFTMATNTSTISVLNSYIVYPVGKKNGIPAYGKIVSIIGNASVTSRPIPKNFDTIQPEWNIKHIIAIYTKNSCQKAFKNHPNGRFTWNDFTGILGRKNPSSIFWPKVIPLAIINFQGYGAFNFSKQTKNTIKLPIELEPGDCVVDAIIPKGNNYYSFIFNTESQIHLQILNP